MSLKIKLPEFQVCSVAEAGTPLMLLGLALSVLGRSLSSSWLLLLLSCICSLSFATEQHREVQLEPRNILFSHLTTRDGLSQASVNTIIQDQQGFIWFGTQEGLNRYDGNKIEVFEHDYKNPNSLSHDWVWSLLLDNEGAVWVGTDGGGLSRFDSENKLFTHFRHEPGNPNSLSGDRVRVVYQDSQGIFWVGTDDAGLNRYDTKRGEFIRYRHDSANPDSLSNDRVLAITQDSQGALWVGTRGGGLDRLDTRTGKFTHFRHDPDNERSLSHNSVRALFEDRAGTLWVGTYEGGLNRYQPKTDTFIRFKHDVNNPNSLSNDRIRDIYQDSYGSLWVATDNGLNEWREEHQGFVRYNHKPSDPDSLSNDKLMSVFQDRGGVLWVATYNGVSKWNYVSESFNYFQDVSKKYRLSSSNITAMAETQDGAIWIGTYGGGLNKLDFVSGETSHYGKHSVNGAGLNDDRIMSIYVDQQQQVWLGTLSGGLNRLNPLTGEFSYFKHDSLDEHSLSTNGVTSIHGDENGDLWVGTYGGGLNLRDPVTGKFKAFRHNPEDSTSISSDRILAIYRDRSGALWIGTEDGGLNRFDPETQGFSRYQHDPSNDQSLANNTAWSILEGKDGSLWVGTQGGGLNRWSAEERQADQPNFKKYRKSDGLASDNIMAILEDKQGSIWLSTNRGLLRLEPDTGLVRHFSRNNGLRSNDFNFSARLASHNGTLYFGSSAGMVSFDPDLIKTNQHRPPLALTAQSRVGLLLTTYSNVPQQTMIKLGYQDELIVFEFAGLDFSAPEKNRYRYKLDGFDRDWSEPVKFQRTTYTNLPTGHYTFKVMAANNDGLWSEQDATFTFEVVPPPWKSTWAYTLYSLCFISLILLYLRTQSRKLRQAKLQQRELEHQVQGRTHELAQRNEQLLQLNETLKEVSVTDALTGLKNRRYVYDYMKSEVAKNQRRAHQHLTDSNEPLDISPGMSIMMIDLDGFKAINDTYGHDSGDEVLIQVRDILRECCRNTDLICRWGGDEFLLLCRDTKPNAMERLAERIREKLATHQFQLGHGQIGKVSGSIGFAPYPFSLRQPDLIDWEQVAAIADRAAYLSKQNGRNAWAGIYSSRNITQQECSQIKNQLHRLFTQERVSLKTSICGELTFDNAVNRQSI